MNSRYPAMIARSANRIETWMIACVCGIFDLHEMQPGQGTTLQKRASTLIGRLRLRERLRYTPACAFNLLLFAHLQSCKLSTVSSCRSVGGRNLRSRIPLGRVV